MTRVLWLTPSDMLTEQYHGSLDSINDGALEIEKCWYDKIGVPVDRAMLDHVARFKPDLCIYISQSDGPYVPSVDTFRHIRDLGGLPIHVCLDGGDVGFRGKLDQYRAADCFRLTIACDGCAAGPVDLISFHPVDPRPYQPERGFGDRPIAIGTAIGMPYGLRRDVMTKLQQECGLVIKPREETYGSYRRYCDFLKACKIIPDCALSAGGPEGRGPYARTLKTRAIEVGLAGACLLELRGCALNKWATEDVDYVTYETPEEAVERAHNMMADPDRTQAMAERLARVVREKMNPMIFWSKVFSACGLRFRF